MKRMRFQAGVRITGSRVRSAAFDVHSHPRELSSMGGTFSLI